MSLVPLPVGVPSDRRTPAVRTALLGAALPVGGAAAAAGLGGLLAVDPLLGLVVGAALLGPALLAVPLVRRLMTSPALLPLLLTAPSAASVFPAVAVPLTTALLAVALLVTAQARLPRPVVAGVVLAGVVATAGVVVGLRGGAAVTPVAGDALQFLGLYLAALVAHRRDPRLLDHRALWGLWLGMVLISLANAAGRVDFLAAAGSDLQRNINFVAPVVVVWGLVHLLWRPVTLPVLVLGGSAALLTLLTFTRGIWAGTAVAGVVVVVWYLLGRGGSYRRLLRLGAAGGLLAAGLAVTAVVAPTAAQVASDKAASFLHRDLDYTYQQRDFESDAVLAQRSEGAFGRGFGADYVVPVGGTVAPGPRHYIHNQYVAQVFRNGVVGSLLSLLSLLLLVRLRRGGPGSALALGTLGYVLVTGITSPSLYTYPTNLLAGLALGGAVWLDARWQPSAQAESSTSAVFAR